MRVHDTLCVLVLLVNIAPRYADATLSSPKDLTNEYGTQVRDFTIHLDVDVGSQNYILNDIYTRYTFETLTKSFINIQNQCQSVQDTYYEMSFNYEYRKKSNQWILGAGQDGRTRSVLQGRKGKGKGKCRGKKCPKKINYSVPTQEGDYSSVTLDEDKNVCEMTLLEFLTSHSSSLFKRLTEIRVISSRAKVKANHLESCNSKCIKQRNVMKNVYNSFDGLTDLMTQDHVCTWGYIKCDGGDDLVTQFIPVHAELSGTIPTELGRLSSVECFWWNGNYFSGTIPTEFSRLKRLSQVKISENYLSGTLPTELGQISQLSYLHLEYNYISGTIPTQVGLLRRLYSLGFNYNFLTGTIPTQFGRLTNLKVLFLSDNLLSGVIPMELVRLRKFTHLHLSNNDLAGTIPTELGLLTNLKVLDLCNNTFTGTIPTELGNLKKLSTLTLLDNYWSGAVPAEVCNLNADVDVC